MTGGVARVWVAMISPYECLNIDATAGVEGAARRRRGGRTRTAKLPHLFWLPFPLRMATWKGRSELHAFKMSKTRAAVAAALPGLPHNTWDHSTEMRSPTTLPATSTRKVPEGS